MIKDYLGVTKELSCSTQLLQPRFKSGDCVLITTYAEPIAAKIVTVLTSYPGVPQYSYLVEYYRNYSGEMWDLVEREIQESKLIPLDDISRLLYMNLKND